MLGTSRLCLGFRDGVYTDWDWQKLVLTTTLSAGHYGTFGLSRKG